MNDQQTRVEHNRGAAMKHYEAPQQLMAVEISMTAVLLGMTGMLAWLWSL